jgi:hypothetical protein
VVVLYRDHPPLILDSLDEGRDLLLLLLAKDGQRRERVSPPKLMWDPQDQESWIGLVRRFEPTVTFLRRAEAQVDTQQEVESQNIEIAQANVWAHRIAYPLNLLAMAIVVYSFGHLLTNKPSLGPFSETHDGEHLARITVTRSLSIFVALSIVDLIWTLTASRVGAMREMNPLGSQLIDDPIRLVAFKFTAVLLAASLLYCLHRRPIAQVASWWSCLLLTLLTARWLTFNAMFL